MAVADAVTPQFQMARVIKRTFSVIGNNTITFSITDGGLGDDDLSANGVIVDQGGPGVPVAGEPTAIPTLSEWARMLLAGLLGVFGIGAVRRKQR